MAQASVVNERKPMYTFENTYGNQMEDRKVEREIIASCAKRHLASCLLRIALDLRASNAGQMKENAKKIMKGAVS